MLYCAKTLIFFIAFYDFFTLIKSEKGYCAPYAGKVCKTYIKNFQVYYPENGGWENEKIATGLFSELIEVLDELCQKPASKLLCAYAFPKCKLIDSVPSPLPLCYEDCVAIEKVFCYDSWMLLLEKKQRSELSLKSRGHFKLPKCDELPRYNKSSKYQTCSYIGLTEMTQNEISCKIIKIDV